MVLVYSRGGRFGAECDLHVFFGFDLQVCFEMECAGLVRDKISIRGGG